MPEAPPVRPSDAPTATLPPTAERLLQVAGGLFARLGFAAVGVDLIARESGIAKMTLYRHFPSKDDLIVAWLERVDALFWATAREWMGPEDRPARDRLLGFFAGLEKMVASPQCLGCPFLLAAAEFPAPESRAHRVALANKTAVRDCFRQLAGAAGARDAASLGDRLLLLMDGAFMAARLFGVANPGNGVLSAATALLDAACDARPVDSAGHGSAVLH